ncbi:MAG: tetratricopeptide repeat protein [Polyangia bacterium]
MCSLAGAARADAGDAAARRTAREHYQKGSVAYELGHYDTAIAEYEAAYQAFNEPSLLYNLGQTHRLAAHWAQAVRFYKMYLLKVPDAPNRADVEAKIAALNATIEREGKAAGNPPDQAIASKPAPTAPTTTVATQPQTTAAPTTAPAAPAPADPVAARPVAHDRGQASRLKIAGITVGAAGVALTVGGIVAGVMASSAAHDLSSADANHQPYDPRRYATYQTNLISSGVLIGVGAIAVISGTTLAVVGLRRARAQNTAWRVAPQLSPTLAGLSVSKRF